VPIRKSYLGLILTVDESYFQAAVVNAAPLIGAPAAREAFSDCERTEYEYRYDFETQGIFYGMKILNKGRGTDPQNQCLGCCSPPGLQ
jgi:hypothetical protein